VGSFSAGEPSRRRPLGLFSSLALGVNGIVGVGIFYAPSEIAAVVPGWRGLWVYALVAILLLPTALVFARLARAFPQDGGPYLYAHAAFGPRVAFVVGWITYVSALFSTATVLVGLVDGSSEAIGAKSAGGRLVTELALLTVLTAALSRGLRLSAFMWSGVTVLKSLPLLALPLAALLGSGALEAAHSSAPAARERLLSAMLPVLFALQGFEVVPLPAAQVQNSRRTVPLATVASLLFAAALYVALHASCLAALPDLGEHKLPLADAALVFGGPIFSRLIVAATSVSAIGIVIGMLAITPRYLAAVGGNEALGFGLDEQSSRAVPEKAFAVTYVFLLSMLLANAVWGSVGQLLALSSLSVTIQYAATAAALFVLASRRKAGLLPSDRWPAPLAVLSCALFMFGASALEIPLLASMLALGSLVRVFAGRGRTGM
jgi:basic amino acid/polyamine antiporter, APA family